MLRSMKLAIVLSFLAALAPTAGSAQAHIQVRGMDKVESGEFTIDLEPSPSAYAGAYHFGDSEWESTLRLSVDGDRVTGRLTWADVVNGRFVGREARLEEGRIVGAMLIAPGWSGVFVRLRGNDYERGGKGLIIFRSPGNRLNTEFGFRWEAPVRR